MALLTTSSWPAELRHGLSFSLLSVWHPVVVCWHGRSPHPESKRLGSNEQPQKPEDQLPQVHAPISFSRPRQQAHYTADATSAGIPLTPLTGCFRLQSAAMS
jgi:hypothetical protein